jgi:maleylpyruvate isomerase
MTTAQGDPEVPTEAIDRWERGEQHLATAIGRLVEEDFDGPSLLPGWDRRDVLAHLARNADAMVNLLTWARTGVETPAYPSDEDRDEQIRQTAEQMPPELKADVLAGTARLAEAVREMTPHAWAASVRARQGHEISGADVIWMRCREVYVHSVDLNSGVEFGDIPADVLAGIVDEVFRAWDRQDTTPDVVVFASDGEWGTGSLAVSGSLPEVAAWLSGRSTGGGLRADGPLPTLPPWL